MAITPTDLLLEIGSEAYERLTAAEVASICQRVSDTTNGGMLAFELLWKKYKPTFKAGKMYVRESDRYETYFRIYNWYCQKVKAGKTSTATEDSPVEQWL